MTSQSNIFIDIPLSITNKNTPTTNAIDKYTPMSFLKFLSTVTFEYDKDTLKQHYHTYLAAWNNVTSNKTVSHQELVTSTYKEFLRDISINYTTNDEKKFLTTLDFNNTRDLRSALSIYSKKIVEIIKYYKGKRNTLEYLHTKQKIKGSVFGTKRKLVDIISNFLLNQSDLVDYDINNVVDNLEISLNELYCTSVDTYNQTPDENISGYLDIDFNENIFIDDDEQILSRIFADVSDEIKNILEVSDLIDNKRKHTEQNISSDFYYLSSNSSGEYVTNRLFESSNSIKSLLNVNSPTVAIINEDQSLKTKEEIGVFTPDKTAIFTIHAEEVDFVVDKDKISPDTLVFYPDPSKVGSDTQAILFRYNIAPFKYSSLAGKAANMPKSDPRVTTAIGYNSKPVYMSNLEFNSDLNYIYDEGYIDNLASDIYGNTFGLIKDNDNFRPVITPSNQFPVIKNLLLDGHTFFDILYGEGSNFDYLHGGSDEYFSNYSFPIVFGGSESLSGTIEYEDISRPGFALMTNGMETLPLSAYTLFMRSFDPYQELYYSENWLKMHSRTSDISLYDGAVFMYDDEALVDSMSSDTLAYPASGEFYYDILIEGGVSTVDPTIVRAVTDNGTSGLADFTESVVYVGDDTVDEYDGGLFSDELELDIEIDYRYSNSNILYYDSVFNETTLLDVELDSDSLHIRQELSGTLYFRDINSGNVANAIDTLVPILSSRYTVDEINELSSNTITDFDLLFDTLFIDTANSTSIIKYIYNNEGIEVPYYPNMIIDHNENDFNKISNRFKVTGNSEVLMFTTTILDSTLSAGNNMVVYPTIYKYSYNDTKLSKIFPIDDSEIDHDLFSLNGGDTKVVEIDTPKITYNETNNLFAISWIAKDQNKSPHIYSYLFDISQDSITFKSGNQYKAASNNYTSVFDDISVLNTGFEPILVSSAATVNNNTLIL